MGLAKYKFSDLIGLSDKRNNELFYGIDNVRGISIQKFLLKQKQIWMAYHYILIL